MREFKPNLIIRAQDIFYSRSLFLTFFPFANYYNRREVEKCSKKEKSIFSEYYWEWLSAASSAFFYRRGLRSILPAPKTTKRPAPSTQRLFIAIGSRTAEDANAIIENAARDLYSVYVYTEGFITFTALSASEDDLAAKKRF